MYLIFKDPKTCQRMHEGPLGQYIDSYATEMCEQGYCEAAAESQTRLVSDFSRWMAERKITPPHITTDRCKIYLRSRAQHRRPKRDDWAALKRLMNLLLRQGVIPEPSSPAATPVTQLQVEYSQYLRQERALVSATVHRYVVLAREFLTHCFGTGPIDLSTLRATDITGFVQRRAAAISGRWAQLITTALRSFLRFARVASIRVDRTSAQ